MRNYIVEQDLEYILSQPLPWKRFSGKTVLISGANGFIPSYLVETLLFLNERDKKNKIKIIGVVRNKEKAQIRFSHLYDRNDIQFIVQDVCRPIKIEGNIDFIIHAASQASPKYYGKNPVETLTANVLGTYNLLELAREKRTEGFLFFSSGEIYGKPLKKSTRITENFYGAVDPTDIRSCYAESKRMGETMCVSFWHQYGVPAKIIRPFHTYGPGINLNDGRVFADFVANIVYNQNIIMKSEGNVSRSFCYIADAVIGFFTVLLKGNNGEAYNVANDKEEITIKNLAAVLVKLFPEKKLKVVKYKRQKTEKYIETQITKNHPDISKLMSLGWKPKYSIEEGFKRTIKSFV